jgi:serine protease Do
MMSLSRHFLAASVLSAALLLPVRAEEKAAPEPPNPPKHLRALTFTTSGSYLGVGVRDICADRAKELKLSEEYGVEVTSVVPDGPAAKGGLQKGDVVLSYNGQRVEGIEQFVRLVSETPAGRKVRLQTVRSGAQHNLEITTGVRRSKMHMPHIEALPNIEMPDLPRSLMSWKSYYLGIEAEPVDAQLAQFFGVKEGVLVRSVNKGTPAEKAGLKAGDVIVKVGSESVSTPREVTTAIRELPSRKSFPLVIFRERKETTLTVHMQDENESSGPGGSASRGQYVVAMPGYGPVESF